ncbi:ABC transporter substrate-binding protein [Chitinimonas sp. BJYL2]|uniref:substrate-binding periplasmic protein n=1 Tax=Chitinimonas sp. BJYL2 TaxID=2976696 RepID=UPI0022B30A96|nr:hypothetical protein [Chitinimonas sp. BJYL2]
MPDRPPGLRLLMIGAVLIAAALLPAQALAREGPATLTLCQEDADNYPWTLTTGPGYSNHLLDRVGQQLGVRIRYVRKPWRRCLLEAQQGAVDGVMDIAWLPERETLGAYPMHKGKPDPRYRLHDDSYSLFTHIDSSLDWDGKQFSQPAPRMAAQVDYSVVSPLRALGAQVTESAKGSVDILRLVVLGNTDGAALLTREGDYQLSRHPDLARQIKRAPQPIFNPPMYLMVSHRIADQHPAWTRKLWETIASVRESAAFQRQAAPLLKP